MASLREIVAWLLTEDGLVDGVIGDGRVGRGDSIWTTSEPDVRWMPRIEDQVGAITLRGHTPHVYHTETGEVLHPTQAPLYHSEYRYYDNILRRDTPPEDSWKTSRDTLEEGWVKDPEGKHRLWVPAKWRKYWNPENWNNDAMIQFNFFEGRPVIIKF